MSLETVLDYYSFSSPPFNSHLNDPSGGGWGGGIVLFIRTGSVCVFGTRFGLVDPVVRTTFIFDNSETLLTRVLSPSLSNRTGSACVLFNRTFLALELTLLFPAMMIQKDLILYQDFGFVTPVVVDFKI